MTDKRKPWEIPESPWKTESSFCAYVRGGIRKSIWNRYPIKTTFILNNRIRGINPKTGRECWGGICYLTGEFFPQAQLEVDHKQGGHSLKTLDDASDFLKGMLYVDFNDLAFVSKEAHKVKSYAEKHNLTFQQAQIEKQVIAKMKLPKKDQDKHLTELGMPCSNDVERRKSWKILIGKGALE